MIITILFWTIPDKMIRINLTKNELKYINDRNRYLQV